jgi:hypothetical protein
MIPLWKGKNPIYFGVITIILFDDLYRRAYFVMHTFLVYGLYLCYKCCLILRVFFFQRITAHLHARKKPPYVINLDPAVHEIPFPANIGIVFKLVVNSS